MRVAMRSLGISIVMKAPSKTSPIAPEPSDDAFTRWWIANVGGRPTAEDIRQFRPRLEKQGLLLPEERYVERVAADLLADVNYRAEKASAVRRGADPADPVFDELARLIEIGRKRRKSRAPTPVDAAKRRRAKSLEFEDRIRKAKKRTAALTLGGKKSRSKVRPPSSARDPRRDRKILKEIHSFLDVGVGVRFTDKRADLVAHLSKSGLSRKSVIVRSTTHDPIIWLPHWDKATLPLHAMAMGIAAGSLGAMAFTLHLGDSGIAYAMGVGEMLFAQRIYRRIRDRLRRGCGDRGIERPELAFFVEQGVGERPHLHGFVFVPPVKKHESLVREMLLKAVGRDWKPYGRNRTQLEFEPMYEPAGWIKYITKHPELTKAAIGDNIFAAGRSITHEGERWWDEIKKSRGLLLPGGAVSRPSRTL